MTLPVEGSIIRTGGGWWQIKHVTTRPSGGRLRIIADAEPIELIPATRDGETSYTIVEPARRGQPTPTPKPIDYDELLRVGLVAETPAPGPIRHRRK